MDRMFWRPLRWNPSVLIWVQMLGPILSCSAASGALLVPSLLVLPSLCRAAHPLSSAFDPYCPPFWLLNDCLCCVALGLGLVLISEMHLKCQNSSFSRPVHLLFLPEILKHSVVGGASWRPRRRPAPPWDMACISSAIKPTTMEPGAGSRGEWVGVARLSC